MKTIEPIEINIVPNKALVYFFIFFKDIPKVSKAPFIINFLQISKQNSPSV